MNERALRVVLPIIVLALVIAGWHAVVRIFAIPPFVLPGPGLVLATLISDGPLLWQSLLVTLTLMFQGFLLAAVGGIALAVMMMLISFILNVIVSVREARRRQDLP